MDLSTIYVYRATGHAVGSLHVDSVKRVANNGFASKSTESVITNPTDVTNMNFFSFKFALECESSERLLFLLFVAILIQ